MSVRISRKKTRRFLLELLYARVISRKNYDDKGTRGSLYFPDFERNIDKEYLKEVFEGVIKNEKIFLAIIKKYAPKFSLQTIPPVHMLILMISMYEMFFLICDKVPGKVSVNEAVEISKIYSDGAGSKFINGVLHSILMNKEEIKKELLTYESEITIF